MLIVKPLENKMSTSLCYFSHRCHDDDDDDDIDDDDDDDDVSP